jgi:hypothetical protein
MVPNVTFCETPAYIKIVVYCAVLWADTDVSEEHEASVFGDEVCWFRSRHVIRKVVIGLRERDKKKEARHGPLGKTGGGKYSYTGHTGLSPQVGNRTVMKNGPSQGFNVVFRRSGIM